MLTTHPFTTSLTLLLLFLLPFTTSTNILLHPYPHPHQPRTTNLLLSYNHPTLLTLSFSPIHPSESLKSLTHTLPLPSIISLTTLTNQTLKATLTLRLIGVTNFSVTARTTNPFHIYNAIINITVPGVTVAYPTTALPAPLSIINLGTYHHWLSISQLALPLLIQPPPNNPQLHLRVAPISTHIINPTVCVLRVHNSPHNTRFFQHSNITTRGVKFPPHCGVALSTLRTWLILRLNPYRVGHYKFSVVFQFLNWNSSYAQGHTTLRFMYEPLIPPVLITNLRVVLDPSGGELLQIPVENVLSPPRNRVLTHHQVVLKLFSGRKLVAVLKPRELRRIGRTPRHILRFRTNSIQGKPRNLTIVLETAGRKAVIDPRHNVSIAVTSRRIAVLDECTRDVADKRFVKIVMHVPYNRNSFTDWKNGLVKRAIRGFFPGQGDDAIRLVDVDDGIVTYAVLVSAASQTVALDARVRDLDRAMRNGSFAYAVHAWKDDVTSREVVYTNKSLCTAFPHLVLSASANEIRGEQMSLLPLCTSVPIAFAFIIAILIAQNGLAKSQETVSNCSGKISEEDSSNNHELNNPHKSKCNTDETVYAQVCSYPSEAREKFARQYGLSDTITSDNVRDSDLESSVEAEREEGLGKLFAVIREFGHDFGGLGRIWRKLRGYEAKELQMSARTGSTNKSPTIYIERVSYDCTFRTAAYS